jgi:hypothetical protein
MEFNPNNAPASGEDANGRPANSGANPDANSGANSGSMPPPDTNQQQPRGRRHNGERRSQSQSYGARRPHIPMEPRLSANFEDGVEIPPSQQELDAHAQAMASFRDAAAKAQEESCQPRKRI